MMMWTTTYMEIRPGQPDCAEDVVSSTTSVVMNQNAPVVGQGDTKARAAIWMRWAAGAPAAARLGHVVEA
jgi:hypothetical protein